MRKLVCELCGSNELLKKDGLFECQMCGTKYTLEEAKKLFIDGDVIINDSVVHIHNGGSNESYYELANNAFVSNNYEEAEQYCKKILENDATNSDAWMLLGKVFLYWYKKDDERFEEAANALAKAVENESGLDKQNKKELAVAEYSKSVLDCFNETCNVYSKNYSGGRADDVRYTFKSINYSMAVFCDRLGVELDEVREQIIKDTEAVVDKARREVPKMYVESEHPGERAWDKYVDAAVGVIDLMDFEIDIKERDNDELCRKYVQIIEMIRELLSSGAWRRDKNNIWEHSHVISDEGKKEYNERIEKYKEKVRSINPEHEILKDKINILGGILGFLIIFGKPIMILIVVILILNAVGC